MITVIGNMKGGTGKSTVAFNLAVWLAYTDQTLRLFDLDPQETLSDVVNVRHEEGYQPILPKAETAESLSSLQNLASVTQQVLIDVSIADKEAMLSAIRLADQIVIPCAPSQADVWSTQKFIQMIRELGVDTPIYGFINRADTHHLVAETDEAEMALSQLPNLNLLPVRLYQRTAYRRSFSEGLAVFELEKTSRAAQEIQQLAQLLYPN